ncbi:ABC transporter permease [Variovorax paradoxus]|uniref:ABC transporter permease n=1 Tax=Variovorax paradoxus TaxID=34073 RepID=UPI000476D15B|nr:ABC transporter permease [Variovorax paradoxus]
MPLESDATHRRAAPKLRITRTALLIPVLLFFAAFFFYPLLTMMARSVTDVPEGAGALSNFQWFFTEESNLRIFGRTLTTAARVTVFCVLVAYPMAYAMMRARGAWKLAILGVVLLPFWISTVVRNFAWVVILQDRGVLNYLLGLGGVPAISILGTKTAVTIGMAQVLLPFAVLPIYNAMQRIDPNLIRAALMLGARPTVAFLKVFLPLSAPGLIAGALLVFVLSLGFYLTPAMLGSAQDAMFAQIIFRQISELLAWGRSSAMATILLLTTIVILTVGSLLTRGMRNRSASQPE